MWQEQFDEWKLRRFKGCRTNISMCVWLIYYMFAPCYLLTYLFILVSKHKKCLKTHCKTYKKKKGSFEQILAIENCWHWKSMFFLYINLFNLKVKASSCLMCFVSFFFLYHNDVCKSIWRFWINFLNFFLCPWPKKKSLFILI